MGGNQFSAVWAPEGLDKMKSEISDNSKITKINVTLYSSWEARPSGQNTPRGCGNNFHTAQF